MGVGAVINKKTLACTDGMHDACLGRNANGECLCPCHGPEVAAIKTEATARFAEAMDLPAVVMHLPIAAPRHTIGCENPQCRVVEYTPHSSKTQDQKCPACYGSPRD